jgi:general secretion pathway protein E
MSSIVKLAKEDLPSIPIILDGVSTRFIRSNRIIPMEITREELKVAMADPDNRTVLAALKMATARKLVIYSAEDGVIDEYLARFYDLESQDVTRIINGINNADADSIEVDEDVEHLKGLASEAPVIKLVNLLLARAVESRASDVHIEPFADELKVRYRIDGILHDIESVPKRLQPAIISRIKIMAKLNIAERRLPQDGRIKIRLDVQEIDLRISIIPVLYGESVVMRILDMTGSAINLNGLGFSGEVLASFNRLITKPNGIILVTGPTGSGKTTTLYGVLDTINSPDKKIITVEDPIEYQITGINQIPVKPSIGLNFASTLRHIVRHDPDVIMIGEIRDRETAEIAIQSALTGHLVFSTLHTNDSPSAITRLIDIGVENFLLSSTVRGILAQRLVRTICPQCREVDKSWQDINELQALGLNSTAELYIGCGCSKCNHTGYFGRIGIFELLLMSEEIRGLIVRNAETSRIREAAVKGGMISLLKDGVQKVLQGITTMREVLRVTQEI